MKTLKFRPVRRWSNGLKYSPSRAGKGLRRINALMAYWRRVGQWGSFRQITRKNAEPRNGHR